MKTTKIASISAIAALAVVALLVVGPAVAATQAASTSQPVPLTGTTLASTSTSNTNLFSSQTPLTAGQTITLTSTTGKYVQLSDHTNNGVASGSVVFTVTGAFKGGYSLSIASGTLAIGSTTYAITSGSAEMGPYQAHLVGQGQTSSSGAFLVAAGAHATFTGKTYDTLRFDLTVGGTEYGVVLLVAATVA